MGAEPDEGKMNVAAIRFATGIFNRDHRMKGGYLDERFYSQNNGFDAL
uniref:Uncharacterized protein n=1 Tax=Candidatus Kentrum sp. LFY TaxID=2126342 RepID=A0A450UKB1_9GAMM|nr:MAG: hypothetical protein BECKLFY1418B_GA0070995_10412 [Candidatus Kentron sp. LFY]